jgi:hypothetical protein
VGIGIKRNDLRAMAQTKLDDAILLLKNRRFSSAYYLSGYAVELGLKACITVQIAADTLPDKAFITKVYDHRLPILVGLAGLTAQLTQQQNSDVNFAANWALVAQWSPESRYETTDPYTAQTMLDAISNQPSGVLEWIRQYW